MIDKSINKNIDSIAIKLKTIPESPGVYQHLDRDGNVIYVGKARNLQRRVSSYFSQYHDKPPKIRLLIRHIHDFRFTVVATEIDALLLENTLIKRYQPRYNSLLKDDKTYPYLLITQEPFPRLVLTRGRSDHGQYFGPYPNQRALRELQDIISNLFPYRRCKNMQKRPCINHQIGLCKSPCAGLQSQQQYLADIDNIRRILKGDFSDIILDLKSEMFRLAELLRFEEADSIKRRIRRLEEYQSSSTVVNTNVRDVDVYSILSDDDTAYVNMMRVKNGSIISSFSHEIKKQLDETDPQILAVLIPQLHQRTESTAREAVVPFPVPDIPDEYLRQTVPVRGDRLKLLQLSQRNVKAFQIQARHQHALLTPGQDAQPSSILLRIQKTLRLPKPPLIIECFDNSNTQGAFPVAAMVRFTNGRPDRKEYRKFNIKTVQGPDDYASMTEVILRRYRRLADEGRPLPDLLLVDGGKGQMEAARQAVHDSLNLDIPIAGLAKDDRHRTAQLLFGFPPQIVGTRPSDPLFHLLEQIQNEVHRFAITFHREKRSKGTFRTQLTDIPSVGPKTAQDLLLKFGSIKQIRLQTVEDLAKVVGPSKAQKILLYLNSNSQ